MRRVRRAAARAIVPRREAVEAVQAVSADSVDAAGRRAGAAEAAPSAGSASEGVDGHAPADGVDSAEVSLLPRADEVLVAPRLAIIRSSLTTFAAAPTRE